MNYPLTEHINVALPVELKNWLYEEADRRISSLSVVVRQAIVAFKEKVEKENEGQNKIDTKVD